MFAEGGVGRAMLSPGPLQIPEGLIVSWSLLFLKCAATKLVMGPLNVPVPYHIDSEVEQIFWLCFIHTCTHSFTHSHKAFMYEADVTE